eukprot:scaffold34234_cov23-Tisochrysis_lutea.AAC.2
MSIGGTEGSDDFTDAMKRRRPEWALLVGWKHEKAAMASLVVGKLQNYKRGSMERDDLIQLAFFVSAL